MLSGLCTPTQLCTQAQQTAMIMRQTMLQDFGTPPWRPACCMLCESCICGCLSDLISMFWSGHMHDSGHETPNLGVNRCYTHTTQPTLDSVSCGTVWFAVWPLQSGSCVLEFWNPCKLGMPASGPAMKPSHEGLTYPGT